MYAKSGWPCQESQRKKNVPHIYTYVIRMHVRYKMYMLRTEPGSVQAILYEVSSVQAALYEAESAGLRTAMIVPSRLRTTTLLRSSFMDGTEDNFYEIGTKTGVISQLYSRNQIMPTDNSFLDVDDVPSVDVALRTVNNETSLLGSQGFVMCSCTTKCSTKRCACKKKGEFCLLYYYNCLCK